MWTSSPSTLPRQSRSAAVAPARSPARTSATAVQGTLDDLGRPLRDTTFVVVDLETTGGSAAGNEITEIGAVKVRGGEVLGEFQTLVRPSAPIPPFIAVLTGITDRMVAEAPRLDAVLPAFLEWSRGAVLVAHNAPFDLGFLAAGCERLGIPWPGPESLDTARLARRVLTRDEAPNCKLATLSRLFRTTTTPCHRALADARATVDVLHGLVERLGTLGVHSLEELRSYSSSVTPEQRRKRHLADGLPHAPGVYLFRDGEGRVLYVGKSKDLRSRVRNYFVASEQRSRMAEMVGLAERVDPVVCAHELEAEVRELRLIAQHRPSYNRRSRHPERTVYLKLTLERFPRLSVVRRVLDDGASYLGPFPGAARAELAMAALHEALPLRQCTGRIPVRSTRPACVLAQMGRCGAPCEGRQTEGEYAVHVEAAREVMASDPARVVEALTGRIGALAAAQRYEEAALARDRLAALVRTAARGQRLVALTRLPLLVAARPADSPAPSRATVPGAAGWQLVAVGHGRLVGASTVPPGAAPRPFVDALLQTRETLPSPGPGPTPCASAEESEVLLRWLERPGTRLVEVDGQWSSPAGGAGRLRAWLDAAELGREAAAPFDDRRGLRPATRPTRALAV